MDTLSLGFVLLIILLGGLTAYIADFLGRLLGKKRLSIFGLRPKHTAVLITTLAGFLIPLLTVLIIITLSHEVKVWLIEGQTAVEERNRKVTELQLVNARVVQKTDEVIQLENQKNTAFQKMQEAQQQLKTLELTAKKLQEQIRTLKVEILTFRKNIQEMHKRYLLLETSHQHLEHASTELKKENSQLTTIQANLENELKDKILLSGKLENKMKQLQDRVDNLHFQKKEILAQYDRLSQQFQIDIQQAKTDLEFARTEKEKAETEIQQLQNIRTTLEAGLNTNVHNTRLLPIIFHEGEELARIQLEPEQNEVAARESIELLIEKARKIAQSRGASPAGRYTHCAGLADLPLEQGILSREEQKESIIQSITHSPENMLLVAHAFWNTYKNEYTIVKLMSHKNPLIYKKGTLLAKTNINGAGTVENIFEQVTHFVHQEIRPKVQKDKLVPLNLPQPQYIEVSYSEMWNLVKRIKEKGEKVQVSAYATANTRAGDLLKLEFTLS